jgi:acetylglutamate kinase
MSKFYQETDYIQQYKGQVVVIKCGGETLNDAAVVDNVIEQAKYLNSHGVRVVLVHGGGNQITDSCAERGITVEKRDGERYTSEEVMGVVDEVMSRLNAALVAQMNSGATGTGALAEGIKSTDFMVMEKQDGKGLTGEPVSVHAPALNKILDQGQIAVVNPVSVTAEGEIVNVNADSSAGAIAKELKAKRAVFCTAKPGVLDKDENVISTITPAHLNALIADGTITDGMVKKVRESSALLDDVEGVAILGSADTDSILQELYGEGSGTLLELSSETDQSSVLQFVVASGGADAQPERPSVPTPV